MRDPDWPWQKRLRAHPVRRNTHRLSVKVRDRVRRTRIPRVWILFMLYLFEFFELNNLHVVTVIIPIIDYVHPKSMARTARINCVRREHHYDHGNSVFVRTPCGGTLTVYR